MLKDPVLRDTNLVIRASHEELMIIDARAFLAGVSRSDFVRNMIDKSWGNRLAKAHRPYVQISGLLQDVSAKLLAIASHVDINDFERKKLLDTNEKLGLVLDQIMERMALDQEVALSVSNEEEAFE